MHNEFDNVMNSLNEQQLKAVSQLDGPVLVLAGAGTGKTKVLTARLAKIILEEKALPDEILCVTFTRKAAKEMDERVNSLIGEYSTKGIWLGTLDAIAYKILRKHTELAGLEEDFDVINTGDDGNRQTIKEGHKDEEIALSNLLPRNLELFLKSPEVLKIYQNKFKYILVDEYQDTNTEQYTWLNFLLGEKEQKNIFCVGDDDQSIYGFRGARIENILNFQRNFENVFKVALEENYRSTKNIVNSASSLISYNSQRLGKTLWTQNEQGEEVNVIKYDTSMEEAVSIAEKIKEIESKGRALSDIAILVRNNYMMKELKLQLKEFGIAFQKKGNRNIEYNSIEDDQDDEDEGESENNDAVLLMTLHAAKGLEFDYVFLPCWEEGSFPDHHSVKDEKRRTNRGYQAIEEERRLAYVGITRARKHLYISHADCRSVYKRGKEFVFSKEPSRFLEELNDLTEIIDVPEKNSNNANSNHIATTLHSVPVIITSESNAPIVEPVRKKQVNKNLHPFDKGNKCHHSKFGEGVIMEVNDSIVLVEFIDGIQKWISASYLELIDAVE